MSDEALNVLLHHNPKQRRRWGVFSWQGKTPPNIPERGERCHMRGRPQFVGILRKYDPETQWSTVEWDEGVIGPKTCHRYELVKI